MLPIGRPGGNLQKGWIQPQGLCASEVSAMLAPVGFAFVGVVLKLHYDPPLISFSPFQTAISVFGVPRCRTKKASIQSWCCFWQMRSAIEEALVGT